MAKTNKARKSGLGILLGGVILLAASCTVDTSGIVFDDDLVNGTGGKDSSGSGGSGLGGEGGDGSGTGGTGVNPTGLCTANAIKCDGKQVQFCTGAAWINMGGACPAGCVDGVCTPCQPDDTQCISELLVQTCAANGDWGPVSSCEFACSENACGGVCHPGDKQCAGAGNKQPQTCDGAGVWQDTGDVCSGVCSAGLCEDCTGTEQRCADATSKQVCVADEWGPATACPFICDSLTNDCGGECVPKSTTCVDTVSYKACGETSGTYGDPVDCGSQACKDGACVGECRPGARQCTGVLRQLCDDNGQWQKEEDCTNPDNAAVTCRAGGAYCGECVTGAVSCDDVVTRSCSDGYWKDGKSCYLGLKGNPGNYCWKGACNTLAQLQDSCEFGLKSVPKGCYAGGKGYFTCDSRGGFTSGTCPTLSTCTNNSGACN